MPYVTSKMGAGVIYAIYGKTAGGLPYIQKEIVVNGGSGVMNKNLITPNGVVTSVSDEEAEMLKSNPLFKLHEANGYVKIHRTAKTKTNDLKEKDNSAQKTAEDYQKKGKKAPKVSKE